MDSPGPKQSVYGGFRPRGPNFGSKGLLEPNSKICTFVTKPHNMGVYGLPWTPVISFWGFGPRGPNFVPKGLLEPNSKISTFLPKLHNMGV